ncbi:ABC transporter substrate-binding protein [Leptospira saintgironsiae]|uniref:Toluene tolerance protein Ttg2D n=1 Tax=Leptospira saintgironsiae TaxID=2023183 RepID=A0A2M9Y8U5_9LEPT|nr:ABC transporter substrate-binding protein [Leptospira saintgironsiae]PJZ47952.1 toluene tolerance protein Ttg2D [Leptospira saintgironsiae]
MKLYQILLFCLLSSGFLFAQDSQTTNETQTTSPEVSAEEQTLSAVKKLIGFIRYKKNDKAIALIHVGKFSEKLIGDHKISAAERKEFEEAISEYIVNKAFPIALKYFDKIDITYDKPAVNGKQARIGSSILYKGSDQIKFAWILSESEGAWYISDFETEGKLATEINRTKNIEPSIKKNGIKGTISLIQKAAKN